MNSKIQSCFPAYMNLKDRTCLIVGGGSVALHKAKILMEYCSDIRVVSESFTDGFEDLKSAGSVQLIQKRYEWGDLDKAALVISASADSQTDLQIYQEACARNIPVNTVDNPQLCTFIFPAIIHDGPLNIAISTNGASPSAARFLKKSIRSVLPDNLSAILEFLSSIRPAVFSAVSSEKKRAHFFRALFEECLHIRRPLSHQEFENRLQAFLDSGAERYPLRKPEVILAGAGCGSASMLTEEVRDLILRAPAVFYDDLIDQSIIDLIAGERIRTGKRKGQHSHTQDEINHMLIEAAKKYPWVLRLKGGDPFVFGRGMEEMEALENAGIQTEVISGLTSCIAVPERMNIPVTDRRMAGSFLVISASVRNPERLFPEDARFLAEYHGTLIILMGFTKISEITGELIRAGKNPETPAAAVSSPSISESIGISSDLQHLAEEARKAGLTPPGILVIGDTVRFMKNAENGNHQNKKLTVGICATEHFFRKIASELPYGIDPQILLHSEIEALRINLRQLLHSDCKSEAPDQEKWLVFLSETGSGLFLKSLREQHMDIRALAPFKIACIGQMTARPLIESGIQPDLIPAHSTSENLARELAVCTAMPARVITFRASQADDRLERDLEKAGLQVTRCNLYTLDFTGSISTEQLCAKDYCGFCFGSRSFAQEFGRLLDSENAQCRKKLLNRPAFCLSEHTAETLRILGFSQIYMPETISAEALAKRITEILFNQ